MLALAERLARGAGALTVRLRAGGGPLGVDAKSTPTDVVTEVDRASERWLADELARLRPDDALLGEEGADRAGGSGVRWVVDPIDGTVNFLYGLRPYAVSVAAERDGRVVAGAVHDPTSGETFGAALGAGAYLDGAPIGGRWVAAGLATAVIATGFGYDAGAAGRAGRGAGRAAAPGRQRAPARLGRARPLLRGRRPAGRLLRARAQGRGTGPPGCWSPPRPARSSAACAAGRRARSPSPPRRRSRPS